jgi:hypothetical protein
MMETAGFSGFIVGTTDFSGLVEAAGSSGLMMETVGSS